MKLVDTPLPGVHLIEPGVFEDPRGFFMETYRQERYAEHGITLPFVQDNLSQSQCGVLRGLHLQHPDDQAKLVYVLQGQVFDVAVDVRVGSPSFARWFGVELSSSNRLQLYIPPGFAHGFCVQSETALFAYKCSEPYVPESEISIAWNDPDIAIDWPLREPSLSSRDQRAPALRSLDRRALPQYSLAPV